MAPVSRDSGGWEHVHRLSQTPTRQPDPHLELIRQTAGIRRGTRMMKVLSARQVTGYLKGWLATGFCYREWDAAELLRSPDGLRLLRTDNDSHTDRPDIAYVLRWRAIDPSDYTVPTPADHLGLITMPSGYRVGPPVLGTGFTPSAQHLIPEFLTTDLLDLPMPAHASLLAHTADGDEVTLYSYQPEQRGWLRMAGARWRGLLAALGPAADQEYLPVPTADRGTSRLIGQFRGDEHDTVADPPEFRVLAMSRAARYPVESLVRRTRYANWRGVRCAVVSDDGGWARLRLCQPDADQVATLAAQCHERGVYETWAPVGDINERWTTDHHYPL
ncbi:hypothetical protein GCM10010201_18920 [Pilimelia columellifera subsp. columellifera]|uniref:Uncharacterized protein n=2 Tax=Pilimelia TaxID=53370 RepID=A0ABP6ARE4_9ACTN